MGQESELEMGEQVQARMSEVWGQGWVSVAPKGTGMSANGPLNESVPLLTGAPSPTGALLLTGAPSPKSAPLIASGKIVSLRARKAPAGRSG